MIQSVEEFLEIVSSDDLEVSRRSAIDSAPLEVWLKIIEMYPEYRRTVAHNKPIPIEVLDILAVDCDVDVRREVAGRRKLSGKLFWLLAKDPSDIVRAKVLQNAKVPNEVLEFLKSDEEEWIRANAEFELQKRGL